MERKSSGKTGEKPAKRRIAAGGDFEIAVSGNGPLLKNLAGIMAEGDFSEVFPGVKLVAHFCPEGKRPARWKSVAAYSSAQEMFADHPGLDLVLDTSRNSEDSNLLRRAAPDGVSVISTSGTHFIVRSLKNGAMLLAGGKRLLRVKMSFLALMDQIEEDVMLMDSEGKLIQVNRYMTEHSGEQLETIFADECSCVDALEACCGVEREMAARWQAEGLGGRKYSEVYTTVNPDGQMSYFRVFIVPVFGERGEKRIVIMRRNITDMVNIEQRLQQSEKMAAIGDLSTYIAHEIRNPLFAIGGFANALLRSSSLDEMAKEKVRIILEESQRLDGILKNILNFARPTDGSVGEVDVEKVLRQTADLMSIGGGERNIVTEVVIAPELPKARGNMDQIKQCLINLVKNAQEAMPEGGVITMKAFMREHMVCISVGDTGVGIPPEVQKQLFSPFFSTKNKGAGLGLAMTKKIIEEIGGKVNLSSTVGQGTTVTLFLSPALAVSEYTLSAREGQEVSEVIISKKKDTKL